MLRCVVKYHPEQQLGGSGFAKYILEAFFEVGIEIVQTR